MMGNEYRVDLSELAEEDLREIARYISRNLSEPATALKILEAMEAALAKLAFMPQAHPKVRDERLAEMGYRFLTIKHYIAFFTVNEEEQVVDVERVLYGRRDWKRVL
jgi:addiction module RelE/StbE family toxin